ncbi:MAG: C4-dicarboxylate ABC transporter substrate-binding protein [Candidatus Latescibacteria bacterium]|nr:C4-dicarboxylate ABC transporter substrate-binding protein [Candidatus Latescibacterota bacterium]
MPLLPLFKGANRDRLKIYGPAALLSVLALVLLFQLVQPAPPQRLVLAAGPAGGAYHDFALHYRRLLAQQEFEIEIRATSGSVENRRLLQEGTVDVAFIQTGVGQSQHNLVSLASLFYEPLWLFHRNPTQPDRLTDLAGSTIAIGPEGSGTRAVAQILLRENGLEAPLTQLSDLSGAAAAQALRQGRIDAALFVTSPQAGVVADLLHDSDIELMHFARAGAYQSRYHYLSSVVLHEGAIDFRRNLPNRSITLLAPVATLVVQPDFHPALIDLLLQAATLVHASGGFFARPGQFPAGDHLDYPLAEDARRYFERGPSFLRRYLPFWAAVFIERTAIFLLPAVTLLISLSRIAVPTYRWKVRSRIYRWYRDLSAVEAAIDQGDQDLETALAQLRRIEAEVAKVEVPLSYTDELYNLRLHIQLVQNKINQQQNPSP